MSKAPAPPKPVEKKKEDVKTRVVTAGDSGAEVHIHKDHKTHVLVFDTGNGSRALVPCQMVTAEVVEREYAVAEEPDTDPA